MIVNNKFNSSLQVHIQFVENILAVYDKFSKIVGSVFVNDQEFFSAMDKVGVGEGESFNFRYRFFTKFSLING